MIISGREREDGLVRSMPPTQPAVVVIRHHTLLALVADHVYRLSEVLRDVVLVAALSKKRVYGLQFSPALFPGYLR